MVVQSNIFLKPLNIYYIVLILFLIIIDRYVGVLGHRKYSVYDINDREKCMMKLEMTNILNPGLIFNDNNYLRVHAVS